MMPANAGLCDLKAATQPAPWDDEITLVDEAHWALAEFRAQEALAWMAAHPEVKTFREAIEAHSGGAA